MIIVLSVLGVVIICGLGFILTDDVFGWDVGFIVSCMLLCFIGIFLALGPPGDYGEILKFNAVQETLVRARANGTDIEDTALQLKVMEKNEWLKSVQFWCRHPLVNWFHNKKVLELQPIQ